MDSQRHKYTARTSVRRTFPATVKARERKAHGSISLNLIKGILVSAVGFIMRNKSYSQKLIISGNVAELYDYGLPVVRSDRRRIGRAGQNGTTDMQKLLNRQKTALRARQTVRRFANSNFNANSKFVTLTFEENVSDLKKANNEFVKFRKRLSRWLDIPLQYIAVPEFQKRGAAHYHLLMNCPYIDSNVLARLWGNGFVKINRIDNVDNIGAYITKYMTKDALDERLAGVKCYFMSHNLKKPEQTTDEETISAVLETLDVKRVACSCSFESDYYGEIRYTQFVLNAPLSLADYRKPPQSVCFPPLWGNSFNPLPI